MARGRRNAVRPECRARANRKRGVAATLGDLARLMLRRLLVVSSLLPVALAGAAWARAGATATTTSFVFTGHGWGHGVGMAQYGALGYALHGVPYGRILQHYYRGVTLGPAPVAKVRVL